MRSGQWGIIPGEKETNRDLTFDARGDLLTFYVLAIEKSDVIFLKVDSQIVTVVLII